MQNILITGGTGLVGTQLCALLTNNGYKVTILTRKMPIQPNNKYTYALWDVTNNYIDPAAITNADHIIHLAGAGVMDKPWTKAYKDEIAHSRVASGKLLLQGLTNNPHKVKSIISTSAIGFYGADSIPNHQFTETDIMSPGFLGYTCQAWEQEILKAETLGIPVTIFRLGIVLSNQGGALKEFLKPLQFRVAGILGNGKQIISWIHINDVCAAYLYALQNNTNGIFNLVANEPTSNRAFNTLLAKVKFGKLFIALPVPTFMLQLILGERSIEILKSATVSNKKLLGAGFTFMYPNLLGALKQLVAKN
jgi:uncharacterized protein